MVKISFSPQDTVRLGVEFSRHLKKGKVVILEGSLGGGKTTFIKGILKGRGYRGKVISPSFVLLRQYRVKGWFIYHLDLYRLKKEEILPLGFEDYLCPQQGISLIEWGGKVEDLLNDYIKIEFFLLGENTRKIVFSFL